MAQLDPNIILQAQAPPPPNPLAIYSQLAGLQHTTQENQLQRQQIGTNQAVSAATQAATDPNTGQVDDNKLIAILSQDRRAQAGLPEILNQVQQHKMSQYSLAMDHLTNMSGRISTLLKSAPNSLTQKDVLQSMGQMLSEGVLTPNEFATETSNLPQNDADLRNWLTGHLNRNLNSEQKLHAIMGTPTATDTGGQVNLSNVSPETGVHPLATITKGISPESASQPTQTGVTAQGAPVIGTRGQFAQEAGAPLPQGGQVTPAVGPAAATAMTGSGAAVQPQATGAPAAHAAPPGPPSGGQGGAPGVVMGLGSAKENYLAGAGKEAADYKNDIDTRTSAGANLVMRMGESLKALGEYKPGASVTIRSQLAQEAQKWGLPQSKVDAIAGGNLGAIQEFQKLAVQQSTEALKQALGSNRIAVMEFDQFQKANPNLASDPRAIQKMYSFANKVYQRDAAEQQEFASYANSGGDVTQFPAYWQNQMVQRGMIDPSAIAVATRSGAPAPGKPRAPAPTSKPAGRKSLSDIFG